MHSVSESAPSERMRRIPEIGPIDSECVEWRACNRTVCVCVCVLTRTAEVRKQPCSRQLPASPTRPGTVVVVQSHQSTEFQPYSTHGAAAARARVCSNNRTGATYVIGASIVITLSTGRRAVINNCNAPSAATTGDTAAGVCITVMQVWCGGREGRRKGEKPVRGVSALKVRRTQLMFREVAAYAPGCV